MKKRNTAIFCPDLIKTQICQAVRRDLETSSQLYDVDQGFTAYLRQRQALEIDKKYISCLSDESHRELAYIKFMFVNHHMEEFSSGQILFPSKSHTMPQSRFDSWTNILIRARNLMGFVLTPFDEDEWFQGCKHGTGSSIGVSYKDTSLEAKSTWPITVTSEAATLLNRYLSFDATLKDAVEKFNEQNPIGSWYQIVESARATTVPKNSQIDRMIAVEPTANMFLQQGLMDMMYRRMKACGLDLELLPTQHKDKARLASITGKYSTIDWSSASDCMGIDLLAWLLPQRWFDCLNVVRSRSILIEDVPVRLSMFSTMGNAGTFPLETLVFWTLAQACRLEELCTLSSFPEWEDLLECSVFGDDCIVPTDISDLFIEVMESVGFICNRRKTFVTNEGFRESCGGDYLRGYDVRPFFLKEPHTKKLSSLEPWLYIIANRLIPKYMVCFGTRDYIYGRAFFQTWFSLFEKYKLKLKLVPPHFPDDSGLRINIDIQRLIACYPAVLSRVGVDEHGSYTFLYLHFQYRKGRRRVDALHYAVWLKNPGGERSPWWEKKEKGGYVVAKGRSGHWSLPRVHYPSRPI